MNSYIDHRQVSDGLASFSVDTGDGGEQYEVDLSSSQNGRCVATDCTEDIQCFPQSYHSNNHISTEGHPQMMGHYQILSHMKPYQDGKFQCDIFPGPCGQAGSLVRSDCIDPALLTAHSQLYDQTLNFDNNDGQAYRYGNHPGQLTSNSAYVRCQQECPSSTENIANDLSCRSSQEIDLRPGYGEGVEDQTHHLSMVSQNVGDNDSAGKPQDIFVAGVLDRSDNHRTTLETYTNRLVGQTEVSTGDAYVQQDYTMFSSVDPSLYFDQIESNQPGTMSPTSLQDFCGQQVLGDGVEGQLIDRPIPTGSHHFVKEGSSAVSDPSVSDPRSWLTSNGRLHPSSNSQLSDVASLTGTDTSGEVLCCLFDGCKVEFTGRHGRGNLGRHRRQKHGTKIAEYPCKDKHCTKTFLRQDARLKHRRKAHPFLNAGPTGQQNLSGSAGSDQIHADQLHTNNEKAPYGTQMNLGDANMSFRRDV